MNRREREREREREIFLLYSDESYSFLLTRRGCPRSLLFREEADSFSSKRRERLVSV